MGRDSGAATQEKGRLALVGALLGGGLLALDLAGSGDSLAFVLLAALTIVAVAVGMVRYRPQPRWIWFAQLTVLTLFLIGGILREVFETLGDLSPDRAPWPEPFSLLGYVVLVVMLTGVARARLGRRWLDVDAMLDASIAGLAALALAWIYLISPTFEQASIPWSVKLAVACYPALSVFVVTIGFRVAFSSAERPPLAFRLMIGAFVMTLIGDVVYMLAELGTIGVTKWVDLPYGLAYVAVITAVLHPSMRQITERPTTAVHREPRRGLAFVALALCVPGAVMLAQPDTDLGDRLVLAAIIVSLMTCASARVFRALRDHARSEARLTHQATHDALTRLPNRVQLEASLTELLGQRQVDDAPFAVLLLDLDRFKLVNDTLGHAVGDELLRAVAHRLDNTKRPGDTVIRIGGDEFAIVLSVVRDADQAREIAERTRLAFGTPFRAGDADITVAASVGVTIVTGAAGDTTPGTILRDADTAMYAAKDKGGDAATFFDDAMHRRVAQRVAIERHIRRAHERGELSVHYQPMVQIADGRVTGLEALLRWEHPELGQVPPSDFIPVCEEIGYIVDLGAWVLDQAVGQLATLRSEVPHSEKLTMAINVSALQLRDSRLCDHVARALLKHGVPPESLCLEITESVLMENLTSIAETLETLRGFGVRIAIDDFGTGYSSLSYLRTLPFDEIKIDREFIRHLGHDHADDTLVAAILAMASSLQATSIAEGVETDEQLARLLELGCVHAQGFRFSRPLPADRVVAEVERLGLAAAPRLRVVRNPA